jgi:TusA-related sulfurtransferase
MPDKDLDVRGFCCPLPLIRIRRLMDGMDKGQVLQVVGDDPIFEESVRDLCHEMHYEVLRVEPSATHVTMLLRR